MALLFSLRTKPIRRTPKNGGAPFFEGDHKIIQLFSNIHSLYSPGE
jgi:hypothetical protein